MTATTRNDIRDQVAWADTPTPTRLCVGDRLTQPEFARLYDPEASKQRYELIRGVVYMAAAAHKAHSNAHYPLTAAIGWYKAGTRGTDCDLDLSMVLSDLDEVMPDVCLWVLPEFGGRARVTETTDGDGKMIGSPELVVEVASSSRNIDLFEKREAYKLGGVQEYIVALARENRLYWWDLPSGAPIHAGKDGIHRSVCFPGLWIDPEAVFSKDITRVVAVVQRGLDTDEHRAFAKQLQERGPKT